MNQSSGGASTHFQVLSKRSRKYFKRAVCMSGTALTFFSVPYRINHRHRMLAFADKMGHKDKSTEGLKSFLMNVSVDAIVGQHSTTYPQYLARLLTLDWTPVIESTNKSKNLFY